MHGPSSAANTLEIQAASSVAPTQPSTLWLIRSRLGAFRTAMALGKCTSRFSRLPYHCPSFSSLWCCLKWHRCWRARRRYSAACLTRRPNLWKLSVWIRFAQLFLPAKRDYAFHPLYDEFMLTFRLALINIRSRSCTSNSVGISTRGCKALRLAFGLCPHAGPGGWKGSCVAHAR